MKELVAVLTDEDLLGKTQQELDELKRRVVDYDSSLVGTSDAAIYVRSLYRRGQILYGVFRTPERKDLFAASVSQLETPFAGYTETFDGVSIQTVPMTKDHVKPLWELFSFTKPVSLRNRRTTVGMGDRLGLATAGQLRAARDYNLAPVLAQQSTRENNFTGRTVEDVVADAAFLVFQEGFEEGYGADGDHLKDISGIDTALQAAIPMITLDLTEVLRPEGATDEIATVEAAFDRLDSDYKQRILGEYADKEFDLDGTAIAISREQAIRAAVIYSQALEFTVEVEQHIKSIRGLEYDLEISVDETTFRTTPQQHLLFVRELRNKGVAINSVAPRFIGDFQKAIDYIGDVDQFEEDFRLHAAVARGNGGYKISVHSGSDKLSIYPVVGKHTGKRLHLKTAGTSWLEALRTIAVADPSLYRRMHRKAHQYYPEALKSYHITADIDAIPDLDGVADKDLHTFLDDDNCRQFLHISYGGLLNDAEIRGDFFAALHREEKLHYRHLEKHFRRHIELLGIEKK